MNKIIILLSLLLISNLSYASLTVSNVPKTKTGGTSPALEDSSISNPSSGNVGIGSTNPGAKLDVNGTVRATLFSGNVTAAGSDTQVTFNDATASSGNAGFVFQKTTGTVTATHLIGEGSGITALSANNVSGVIPIANLATGTPTGSKFIRDDGVLAVPAGGGISGLTTNVLSKAASSTTIGNSQVFDNGTNVGVGSANPGAYLDINGAERIMGQWNIGVGTVSPAQSLSVNGNASFNGGISTSTWTDPINDWNAAGVNTTTTGTISSGTNSLVVASASGWSVGMGIAIANAGTGGNTELITYITGISGTTFTLNDNAIATATTQTVNHDDTRALQAAFDSTKNVHIRAGNYNYTSTLTASVIKIIIGDGFTNRGGSSTGSATTVLNYRKTSGNGITISSGYVQLRDFTMQVDSTVSHTSGYGIEITNTTGITDRESDLNHLIIYNFDGGIKYTNTVSGAGSIAHWNNIVIALRNGSSSNGIYYAMTGTSGDNWISDVYITAVLGGTHTGNGIYIAGGDTSLWTNMKTISGTTGLKIDDSVGAVQLQRFQGCSFENWSTNGINISATNTNGVFAVSFTNGEIGAGQTHTGMIVSGNASHVSVIGMVFSSLATGISFNNPGAYDTAIGNNFYNMTNAGIVLGSSSATNNITLLGNNCGGTVVQCVKYNAQPSSVIYLGTDLGTPNIGIGTSIPRFNLDVVGTGYVSGNLGIGTLNPGTALEIGPGLGIRAVGIGTTVPQQSCRKSDGTFGTFDGAWASICN